MSFNLSDPILLHVYDILRGNLGKVFVVRNGKLYSLEKIYDDNIGRKNKIKLDLWKKEMYKGQMACQWERVNKNVLSQIISKDLVNGMELCIL